MAHKSERTLQRGKLVFDVSNGLVIKLISGVATGEIVLPYPGAGYGGHELVVSCDEARLALYLFSGQSAQGWELFALSPNLRHLGGLPYVEGEGDAPVFSPDGDWLAMLVSVSARVRDTGAYFEDESDPDADDPLIVDWAHLYVQRMPDGEIARHAVGALVPRSLDPDDINQWTTYGAMRFVAADALGITMPWGEQLTCSLPITHVPIETYPSK